MKHLPHHDVSSTLFESRLEWRMPWVLKVVCDAKRGEGFCKLPRPMTQAMSGSGGGGQGEGGGEGSGARFAPRVKYIDV